jgi:3-hydroxyacyl-CoA dehydrogenase
VDDVDLVFEAVFERIEVKHVVLATIEATARHETLIASNTSSLPIDELAAGLRHPRRFIGMHWFNPPEWTPGIELIPAQVTEVQVVEQARSFLTAIGKRPIVVGSGPGFVANRIHMLARLLHSSQNLAEMARESRHPRLGQTREIGIGHADRVRVGSGLKNELLIFRKQAINIHPDPV